MNFKPARLLLALIAIAVTPAFAQNLAVVNGKPIPSATLAFHNNSLVERGSFTFTNCTIFSVTHDKNDSSSEDIRMVKVEMAIEGLEFKMGA